MIVVSSSLVVIEAASTLKGGHFPTLPKFLKTVHASKLICHFQPRLGALYTFRGKLESGLWASNFRVTEMWGMLKGADL